MTPEELRSRINELIDTGDEAALEKFMIDHFKELPEDVQGQMLVGFMDEALQKHDVDIEIAQIQQEGLKALKEISELKERILSAEFGD